MIEYYKNLSLESLFYINEEGLVCLEEWKNIPDYIGYYQVSNLGRLKSLNRKILKINNMTQKFRERILKQKISPAGYLMAVLTNTKKITSYSVHQLVCITFLNHKPCGYNLVIDHKNDTKLDNRLTNLQIITHRANVSKNRKNNSGNTCVSIIKKKFGVNLVFNGETISLGSFETLDKANDVYKKAIELIEQKKDFMHLKNTKVSSTGIKGVYIDKGKYRAIYFKNGKNINIGTFTTSTDAKKAYDEYVYKNPKITTIKNPNI